MTDRELMQQALEALEEINKLSVGENAICLPAEIDGAMDALRERLAQPEQEPVAWVCYGSASDEKHTIDYQQEDIDAVPVGTMLYTTPPQRKPLTQDIDAPLTLNGVALYPRQQPLSDEDLRRLADKHLFYQPESYEVSGVFALARAIEAAHGIKGEA